MNDECHQVQMLPMLMQPQQMGQDHLRAEVPPRVRIAYQLLEQLTAKTSVHLAAETDSHDGFNSAKGQTLTGEEQRAQASALGLLMQYFAGKLKEGRWDGVRESQLVESEDVEKWNVIPCPACSMDRRLVGNCLLCGNAARVKVARVG